MLTQSSKPVALITGGARRIGAMIAHFLHDAGMNIIVHYQHSEDEAVKLCKKMNAEREHSATYLQADLNRFDEIKPLIDQAFGVWQRLDVLVNNASRFYRTLFTNATESAWNDLLDCNLKAPFFLSQAAAPYLSDTRGTIINITDIHAERPLKEYALYCISKSGLLMLTKLLAKELGPSVRVNAVAPGAILWPEGDNELSAEEKENIIDNTILHRSGSAEDIAKAVLFLVQDAPYVTGQVINVDGGRTLCK